jgi:phenylacetate-coenzyme A ligase PaaK-like adenylate-forming protein
VSLDGVTFFLRSEPYTEAKMRTIQASGARAVASYGSTEATLIAFSCAAPRAPDDLHVFEDRYALVQRTRELDASGAEIDALMVTTLSDHAPKTFLNVETGEFGELERRDCDCELGAIGLRTHLSYIRSFEKLTGEGMTFTRTNLAHVVETVLPARFGGTSIDYQVLEEERPGGLPRLVLRVNPSVGALDEAAARTAFLETLAQEGDLERYMAAFWKRANTIEIERQAPFATPAGKILPFQIVRAPRGSKAESIS